MMGMLIAKQVALGARAIGGDDIAKVSGKFEVDTAFELLDRVHAIVDDADLDALTGIPLVERVESVGEFRPRVIATKFVGIIRAATGSRRRRIDDEIMWRWWRR